MRTVCSYAYCTYVCNLFILHFCIQKTSATESIPRESEHAASEKLEEKTKQIDSLQSRVKDLEDQNRDLQKKLENVCAYIHTILNIRMAHAIK